MRILYPYNLANSINKNYTWRWIIVCPFAKISMLFNKIKLPTAGQLCLINITRIELRTFDYPSAEDTIHFLLLVLLLWDICGNLIFFILIIYPPSKNSITFYCVQFIALIIEWWIIKDNFLILWLNWILNKNYNDLK